MWLQASGSVGHAALRDVLFCRQETVDHFGNKGFEWDRERTEAAFAKLVRDVLGPIQTLLQQFGFHRAVKVNGIIAERDSVRKLDGVSGLPFNLSGSESVNANNPTAFARVGHYGKVVKRGLEWG